MSVTSSAGCPFGWVSALSFRAYEICNCTYRCSAMLSGLGGNGLRESESYKYKVLIDSSSLVEGCGRLTTQKFRVPVWALSPI